MNNEHIVCREGYASSTNMVKFFVMTAVTIVAIIFTATAATCSADDTQPASAVIEIMPTDVISTVSPYLFGTNIRWLWNADGAWDRQKKTANDKVFNALSRLKPTVMRYPGGSEANKYDWKAGIGPVQSRKTVTGIDGKDINHFGTDEFLALCKSIGMEPLITANPVTLTARDTADWVRHTNHGSENGAPRVTYWEIGNEPEWTGLKIEAYAEKVNLFAKAMKAADPNIQIGAAVSDRRGKDSLKWDSVLLKSAGKSIDFVTPHIYSSLNMGWTFYTNETKSAEFAVDSDGMYMVELIAQGTPADNGWPIIEVNANNSKAGVLTVDSPVWRTYRIPVNLSAGRNRISISYLNDLVSARGEDRNCFIYDLLVMKGREVIYQLYSNEHIDRAVFGTISEHEARLKKLKALLKEAVPDKDIKIAITEYNIIYNGSGTVPLMYRSRFNEVSNLRSALFVSDLLALFIKQNVWMANYWALMGGMGNLQVTGETLSYRPSYYALKMFREHAGQRLCSNSVDVATMDSIQLDSCPAYKDMPLLGVTSTVDLNGRIIISVINRSGSTDINSIIRIKGGSSGYLRKSTALTGDKMESDGKFGGAVSYQSTDALAGTSEFNQFFPKHSVVQIELIPQGT